jgi:hypothetical protein
MIERRQNEITVLPENPKFHKLFLLTDFMNNERLVEKLVLIQCILKCQDGEKEVVCPERWREGKGLPETSPGGGLQLVVRLHCTALHCTALHCVETSGQHCATSGKSNWRQNYQMQAMYSESERR